MNPLESLIAGACFAFGAVTVIAITGLLTKTKKNNYEEAVKCYWAESLSKHERQLAIQKRIAEAAERIAEERKQP